MKNIRMIATDLDGTLLRSDKSVSQYTLSVIKRAREKGLLFVIATARPVRSVEEMLPQLLFDAGVYHNGAVIHRGGKRVGGFGIEKPERIVQGILRALPDSRISVESEEVLYANYPADETWPGIKYTFDRDFSALKGKISDKIIVEANAQEKVDRINGLLPEELYAQLCEGRLALCMHKNASKPQAIEMLCRMYGIGMNEVVSFGDDINDIAMLRACGKGVAVANALEQVKQAAGEATLSNDEDGVARWIEEYLL